ncbi:MED6-domain-containing protein [Xylona heveae TC161]|uniref:Mediator of RNA polymerase II transcription subunit 6 n=1 Tax=Xylona heveae (strain CBS 132557 / TC161) TaxID=1328760 RepID=A0A165FTW1_XYLHT|nr:MED6-domain-containing protein [Xylona heveae TC161]KZF21371.1 MED6-domain-containing protein [Xylona heveae TC161]
MSGSKEPALDEIQWRSPAIAQSMGGIHTNTVLPYFSHSPFFDSTSNNAILTTQATFNMAMFHFIQTREAFEGRLRTMQGLEFMVAHTPSQPPHGGMPLGPPDENTTGAWIIRKQIRRKRPGAEDEITVLSSYFVVGENIYMAPSVSNVIGSRMLSTVTSLTRFLSTASSLPIFSPSLGHIYIPPVPQQQATSFAGTSTQVSKENTPMPDSASQAQSQGNGSKSAGIAVNTAASSVQELRALEDSFALSLKYAGNEYMDDNPLVGEPGSFIISTGRGPQSTSTATPQPPTAKITSLPSRPSAPPTPQPKSLPSPAAAVAVAGKKSARSATSEKNPTVAGPKPKRRKSKVGGSATSPTTPTTPGGASPK